MSRSISRPSRGCTKSFVISRQPPDARADPQWLFPAFPEWLVFRLNGNTVKQKLAYGFNDAAGGILHSDTAASGQQHGITFRNGLIDLLRKQCSSSTTIP